MDHQDIENDQQTRDGNQEQDVFNFSPNESMAKAQTQVASASLIFDSYGNNDKQQTNADFGRQRKKGSKRGSGKSGISQNPFEQSLNQKTLNNQWAELLHESKVETIALDDLQSSREAEESKYGSQTTNLLTKEKLYYVTNTDDMKPSLPKLSYEEAEKRQNKTTFGSKDKQMQQSNSSDDLMQLAYQKIEESPSKQNVKLQHQARSRISKIKQKLFRKKQPKGGKMVYTTITQRESNYSNMACQSEQQVLSTEGDNNISKSIFQTNDDRIFTEGQQMEDTTSKDEQFGLQQRFDQSTHGKITSQNMSLIAEEEKSSETKTKNDSEESSNINFQKPKMMENFFYPSMSPDQDSVLRKQLQKSEDDDEYDQSPIRLQDILNNKEQEAIEKLSHNKSNNSSKSGSKQHIMQDITLSLSSNPSFGASNKGPLENFSLDQKGTSIQIMGIKNEADNQILMSIIEKNNVQPDRIIPIAKTNEVILQMLSYRDCTQAIKILRDNGIKFFNKNMHKNFNKIMSKYSSPNSEARYGNFIRNSQSDMLSNSRANQSAFKINPTIESFNMAELQNAIDEMNQQKSAMKNVNSFKSSQDGKFGSAMQKPINKIDFKKDKNMPKTQNQSLNINSAQNPGTTAFSAGNEILQPDQKSDHSCSSASEKFSYIPPLNQNNQIQMEQMQFMNSQQQKLMYDNYLKQLYQYQQLMQAQQQLFMNNFQGQMVPQINPPNFAPNPYGMQPMQYQPTAQPGMFQGQQQQQPMQFPGNNNNSSRRVQFPNQQQYQQPNQFQIQPPQNMYPYQQVQQSQQQFQPQPNILRKQTGDFGQIEEQDIEETEHEPTEATEDGGEIKQKQIELDKLVIKEDYFGDQKTQEAPKKKVLIGPKNNQIDFERILYAQENGDEEVLKQTTLMIRNIPIKFTQQIMMDLINEKYKDQYDYFYLPKDLKTQCGVGFAFINFIHPLYILDFYLEYNCIKWSEKIEKCNSTKYCQITYANVQGIEEITNELSDKNVMKKTEDNMKPQFFENLHVDQDDLIEIEHKFKNNTEHINFYVNKLQVFEKIYQIIDQQKQEAAIQKELDKNKPPNTKNNKKKKKKNQANEEAALNVQTPLAHGEQQSQDQSANFVPTFGSVGNNNQPQFTPTAYLLSANENFEGAFGQYQPQHTYNNNQHTVPQVNPTPYGQQQHQNQPSIFSKPYVNENKKQ